MNEYQIAWIIGACVSGAAVAAYIFSWIAQWAWAWIDDSEIGKRNWVASKIQVNAWKYPVFNASEREIKEYGADQLRVFGYAKDKTLENGSVHSLEEGKDYIYTWRVPLGSFPGVVFACFFAPIACLLAIKIYPVTIGIATALLLAYLARFSRRHKKMFDDHLSDKAAHFGENNNNK